MMRFAMLLVAMLLWVTPARAGLIIDGVGTGILREQPGCIDGQIFNPACSAPFIQTAVAYFVHWEFTDFFIDQNGFGNVGGKGTPGCIFYACTYTAGPGGQFSFSSYPGLGYPSALLQFGGVGTARTAPVSGLVFSSIAIPPVPEPATWAMFLLGFAAVGAVLRHAATSNLLNPSPGQLTYSKP